MWYNSGNLITEAPAVREHPGARVDTLEVPTMFDHTTDSTPHKVCSRCGEDKPLSEYHKCQAAKDGHGYACKECARAAARESMQKYRENNRESVRAYQRQYRRENIDRILERERASRERNKPARNASLRERYATDDEYREACKAQARVYYHDNRDKCLAKNKRWVAENREHVRESHRARHQRYVERHRDKLRNRWRVYSHHRRAMLREAEGTHTPEDIQLIGDRQGWRCWWCQADCADDYHVDHRVPISKGGSNGPENLVVSCPACNVRKSDKLPHEFNGRLL